MVSVDVGSPVLPNAGGTAAVTHWTISMILGSRLRPEESVTTDSPLPECSEYWDLGPDINLRSKEPGLERRSQWLVEEVRSQDRLVLDLHSIFRGSDGRMFSSLAMLSDSCLGLSVPGAIMATTDTAIAIKKMYSRSPADKSFNDVGYSVR
jgi:hypothetical protein